MFLCINKKILFLSLLSCCVLVGMENTYFSVQTLSSFRFFPVNGPARTMYPILITDKIRNTPKGYNFFNYPIRSIRPEATCQFVALVELGDNTIRRIDLRTGNELNRIQ